MLQCVPTIFFLLNDIMRYWSCSVSIVTRVVCGLLFPGGLVSFHLRRRRGLTQPADGCPIRVTVTLSRLPRTPRLFDVAGRNSTGKGRTLQTFAGRTLMQSTCHITDLYLDAPPLPPPHTPPPSVLSLCLLTLSYYWWLGGLVWTLPRLSSCCVSGEGSVSRLEGRHVQLTGASLMLELSCLHKSGE